MMLLAVIPHVRSPAAATGTRPSGQGLGVPSCLRRLMALWLRSLMVVALWAAVISACSTLALGQAAAVNTRENLAERQREINAAFEKFRIMLLRLAELRELSKPEQVALVEKAIRQAESRQIAVRMNRVAELLATGRLASAAEEQERLLEDLQALVELLLTEDRDRLREEERKRLEAWLRRVEEIARLQRDLRARTARPESAQGRLAEEQENLADETGRLGKSLSGRSEGASRQQPQEAAESAASEEESSPAEQAGASPQPAQSAEGKTPSSEAQQTQDAQPSGESAEPSSGQSGAQGSDSSRPQERAADALRAAERRMIQAAERLRQAQRQGALAEQEQALAELERAKAELQRILRQLRQEEIARRLRSIQLRIERMLQLQRQVYKETEELAAIPEQRRGREEVLQIARLGRQEGQIGWEADQMLLLLKEDATAAAMIEATSQLRVDIRMVEQLFAAQDVGRLNLSTQQAILAALQEMLDAVRERLEELEKGEEQQGGSLMAGMPPLVDLLAELRMIRTLQQRIRTRTEEYQRWLAAGTEAAEPIEKALQSLAERQARLREITRELSTKIRP